MQPAALIRLRPCGPWRYGPGDGGHDRVDALYRSDRLYSAVTLAMARLGWLEEWLDATARRTKPGVVFTSLFPYQGDTLFAPPPATLWPPPASLVTAPSPVFLAKVRWNAARFVPVSLIDTIASGQTILADQWIPDAESGCLLRRDRPSSSPFRVVTRVRGAVDRISRANTHVDTFACVEFETGAGLWAIARYADATEESAWSERVKGALGLLADTGFGAQRTSGWGQTEVPEVQQGVWPGLLLPKLARASNGGNAAADSQSAAASYWMLSLYSPASADAIDWRAGRYQPVTRGGRIENRAPQASRKKAVRMIAEGAVITADAEPVGTAVDVAPEGLPHPVYRAGFAVAVKLPSIEMASEPAAVEMPMEEAFEAPCTDRETGTVTTAKRLTEEQGPGEEVRGVGDSAPKSEGAPVDTVAAATAEEPILQTEVEKAEESLKSSNGEQGDAI